MLTPAQANGNSTGTYEELLEYKLNLIIRNDGLKPNRLKSIVNTPPFIASQLFFSFREARR